MILWFTIMIDCLQTAKCDGRRLELCSKESSYIISFDTSLLLKTQYVYIHIKLAINLKYVRKKMLYYLNPTFNCMFV